MHGQPAFFEIGVADADKARAFYGALFGWRLTPTGGGAQIATDGIPGGVHGADPGAVPYLFFAVDDMDAALARVRELGGSVQDLDVGEGFKLCLDDQGSHFGLHDPSATARAGAQ